MTSVLPNPTASRSLRVGVWVAKGLLAVLFFFSAYMKLLTPIPELAKMMPWTGVLPETFVRIMGFIDLAGGLGLLLPSLTRILPRLTVLAALCCSVLQVFAMVFHVSRGEASVIPRNVVMLSLSLFVLWGRARKAPILPR
ncbi:DoxX family protein [Sodalis sp. RH22]|uniref:DoxX family protein n=1 Tax=unclassified Sodalis (in: enterobacteria) TaxID=2636512 RepID=UPI0039B5B70F